VNPFLGMNVGTEHKNRGDSTFREGVIESMSGPKDHQVPHKMNPVDQPACVGYRPAAHSPIVPVMGIPQPGSYITHLEPVFIQHMSRHQGQFIALMTSAGRVEGELAGVGIDHVQLNLKDRSLHIRISQIIYFEGALASYR